MSDTRTGSARPADHANGELRNRVQQLRLDNQLGAKTGSGGASWLPWTLCAFLALTWAGVAVRSYRAAPHDSAAVAEPTTSPGTKTTASAATASPTTEAGTIQLEVKGYLVPAQQIAVSPIDVGGRLIELNFVEGTRYPEGYVLAKIDAQSYEAARNESAAMLVAAKQRREAAEQKLAEMTNIRTAEIEQVKAQIAEADALKVLAEADYTRLMNSPTSRQERDKALADRRTTVARLDKLRADLEILERGRPAKIEAAKADVDAAKADVKAAEARLAQAEWRVKNCTIKAPITGTVLSKKAEMGNLVNPMAFSASTSGGGAVCDMANLADLEADVKIPERDISKLKVGQPCRIRTDAYPNHVYDGRLDRIMPIANRSDNTVIVRVKVKLPDGEEPGTYLKPEMGAVVSFLHMR
jgi:multidrug resistance efflux pump